MSICVAMVNAHEVEQGPRVSLRLMVVLTQTLFFWAVARPVMPPHQAAKYHKRWIGEVLQH